MRASCNNTCEIVLPAALAWEETITTKGWNVHPFATLWGISFTLLDEHHFTGGNIVARFQSEQVHARGHVSVS